MYTIIRGEFTVRGIAEALKFTSYMRVLLTIMFQKIKVFIIRNLEDIYFLERSHETEITMHNIYNIIPRLTLKFCSKLLEYRLSEAFCMRSCRSNNS